MQPTASLNANKPSGCRDVPMSRSINAYAAELELINLVAPTTATDGRAVVCIVGKALMGVAG